MCVRNKGESESCERTEISRLVIWFIATFFPQWYGVIKSIKIRRCLGVIKWQRKKLDGRIWAPCELAIDLFFRRIKMPSNWIAAFNWRLNVRMNSTLPFEIAKVQQHLTWPYSIPTTIKSNQIDSNRIEFDFTTRTKSYTANRPCCMDYIYR